MAKFTNNVLSLLDRIYNFVGTTGGRGSMDLSSDIIRVHDVSRAAELPADLGPQIDARGNPYFIIAHDHVHAGATTIADQLGVYSNQSPTWALASWVAPDPVTETVWILGAWVESVAGLITLGQVGLQQTGKAGAASGAAPVIPLAFVTSHIGVAWAAGGFFIANAQTSSTLAASPMLARPIPILNNLLNNSPIQLISTASAAETADFYIMCMRLPIGVQPPGLS